MRTSLATVCLSGTLEDRLDAAAAAGFDAVEIFENDLIASVSSPEEIRRRVAGLGLTIDLYQPFRDAEATPPQRFATVERHQVQLRRSALRGPQEHHRSAVRADHRLRVPRTEGEISRPTVGIRSQPKQRAAVEIGVQIGSRHGEHDRSVTADRRSAGSAEQREISRFHSPAG